MLSRRILALFAFASVLLLAGCIKPAEDSFEPLDSQGSEGQIIPQNPTDLPEETDVPVLIIDPNANNEETSETEEVVETEEAFETEEIVEEEASPTLRVIDPTATTENLPSSTPNIIPTATQAQFITPEVNVEAVIPDATATIFIDQPTLEPTPTTFGDSEEPIELGECDYVVQSGDTLFRIALNNDLTLAELLEANSLTEDAIIQPEQVLVIPNCADEEEPEAVETEEAVELGDCDYVVQSGDTLFEIALNNEVALDDLLEVNELTEASIIQPEQVLRLPDCEDGTSGDEEEEPIVTEAASGEQIHTVVSGDTLLSIARTYGVTVNEIIQANNIPNPNNLTVGQQLVIPEPEGD